MERTTASTLLHVVRVRLLEDYPAQIRACLDVLTDDQIWWRPHEQANAVGNLVLHLAGSNRFHFEQVIAGRDVGRDREAEFSVRGGFSKAGVRAAWEESMAAVTEVLSGIDPTQLMQTTDRTGKTTTYTQILLHVSHHNALHAGQILWVTKLLQPGSIDDIGRRRHAK
jgi:uncharacterized damage-inducible protein DinB